MIPLTKPSITARELTYVDHAVAHANIGAGEYIGRFERAWAEYNGMAFGVSCSSGSAALLLALKALGIKSGDEVIVPDFTSVACIRAVEVCGATPVLVDCRDDMLMDPELVRAALTHKTRAIMAVAIYGRPVDAEIYDMGVPVIDDLAEGHGITPRGVIACYSFYGNKILTTGEGGMCLTDNEHLAQEMRDFANFFFDKGRRNLHDRAGWNFRLTNIQAAIGLAQVERATEILRGRKIAMDWYAEFLPVEYAGPAREVGWLYDVRQIKDQSIVRGRLEHEGIEVREFFKPLHQQPPFTGYKMITKQTSPMSYLLGYSGLLLPLHPDLKKEDVQKICEALQKCNI